MIKFLISLLLATPLLAGSLSGTVKRVADGDSLQLTDGTRVIIWGIDAPEKDQAYGDKATAYLDKITKGRKITLKVRETDRFGRTVAEVYAGKTDIGLFMVRSGMAWHDDFHAPDADKLAEAMNKARKARKGLWQDPKPVKPHLFRKGIIHAAPADADATPAANEALCEHVQDGDSFTLANGDTVRLWGIDAPEKGQAYGDAARARLRQLCEGKRVRLELKETDQYGRITALVYVGKTYVNLQMVKEGMAWHYAYYAPHATDLAQAQETARKNRKGLWQDKTPVNPYEFRKARRN